MKAETDDPIRRTRWKVGALGAAVLAVAGIIGLVQVIGNGEQAGSAPAPVDRPALTGEPTDVPYWTDGSLHVGSVARLR